MSTRSRSSPSASSSGSDSNSRHPEWINKCREILISTETTNIASRVCHWRRIVNEKTDLTNERLNIFIPQNLIPKFEWRVNNLSKYIQFVIQWNGLKMKQIKNSPNSYEEYERKARNWLNGRRAPNYAGTLFPDMIKSSEQYSDTVSKHLFGPNNQYSKAYHKILMFGYLHALCSVRISMNDVSKKTFLLCENSIKTNSVTSVLLQQYATDHPFAQYFPSHLKQAADYFQNKFENDIKRFGNALRLAAGYNMNVNQVNPSISAAIPLTPSMSHSITNMNGITGLNINDLHSINGISHSYQNQNSHSHSYRTNNMFGLNFNNLSNLNSLANNRIIITTNTNTNTKSQKLDLNGDTKKHMIKSDALQQTQALSPLSVTNSASTNSILSSNNANSQFRSQNSNTNISLPQIPNLTIPPQIPNTQSKPTQIRINPSNDSRITVNGKEESMVSFLNQIVNTCNNQQIFMQRLQNRVQSMEQIIKTIKPNLSDNNGVNNALKPLPQIQECERVKSNQSTQSMPSLSNKSQSHSQSPQHLQFIINPQMGHSNNSAQIQFQQIQTQQIQPIHVQQIGTQSTLSFGAASLPNIIANIPIHSTQTKTETNVHKFRQNNCGMDLDLQRTAKMLLSLKDKVVVPKTEKRERDSINGTDGESSRNTPPTKRRKTQGTLTANGLQNVIFGAINTKAKQS